MPSGLFSVFDNVFPIQLLSETPAVVNQTTGAVTPRSFTTTTIDGHVSYQQRSSEMLNRLVRQQGLEQDGTARLHTEAAVKVGDTIRVHNDATMANYTDFRVTVLVSDHPLMRRYFTVTRRTWKMERIGV